MDRHVEFATQLARLVALYAHQPVDHAGEKAALRAARAAAKHGAVNLVVEDGVLMAGAHQLDLAIANASMLRDLFAALGITRLHVAHQAKQEEIKAIARLLAETVDGDRSPHTFAAALAAREWEEVGVELAMVAPPASSAEAAAVVESPEPEEAAPTPAAATAEGEPAPPEAPTATRIEALAASPVDSATADAIAEEAAERARTAIASLDGEAPAGEPAEPYSGTPIATEVPPSVKQLGEERLRELFERLITASEPGTLRRLLDPIQLCVEQECREGHMLVALQLLLAMSDCEDLCSDPEMRRQFVITLRRMTKPTLLRALAALYTDEPGTAESLERVLARFGEDGAEAVADRAACAPDPDARSGYLLLLSRMPAARDAVVSMLHDDRPHIVERGIDFIVQLRLTDAEKVIADQLAHADARVRRAAAQALGSFQGSAFAADALLRAVQDPSPDVRMTAAVALQGRREARLAQPIAQRVDDEPELDVQLALVTTLGRLAAPEGVQKLIALSMPDTRLLRKSRDASILRLSAIEAMGEARTPQAMVTLQKLLEDSQKEVREAAARLYTRARRQTTATSTPVVSEP